MNNIEIYWMHTVWKSILFAIVSSVLMLNPNRLIAEEELSEKPQEPPPMPVTIAFPEKRTITEWNEYTGRFEASQHVEIRSRISGYLNEIHFKDGQFVKEGDLLFTIDPRPYEAIAQAAKAELFRAETEYSLAAQELGRAKRLVKKKAMSQEEVDVRNSSMKTSKASIAAAKASVRSAELEVEYCQITAPISGRVSNRRIDVGNLIQLGGIQNLTTIVAQTPIYFVFDVSESDYLKYIRQGSNSNNMFDQALAIDVKLLDETAFEHRGKLDFVDTQLDDASGTIRIRATFDNNAGGLLLPGVFGRARISAGPAAEALLIPDHAILSDMDKKIVMTVDKQDQVVPKQVELGSIHDGLRLIRSGLTEQDRVITEGLLRVRPGSKVAPHKKSLEKI
ncbi:MAG: efflux RND transporter periplasmic adaptor subunit [Gammaproteobacteria bacterium]